MKITDRIVGFFDRTNDVLALLSGAVLIFIVLTVSIEVIARYFLNSPIIWVVEVNENCLLYLTFLVVARVLARNGHVRVEMVITRLSPKNQQILELITSVIGMVVCFIVTWYAVKVTWQDFQAGAFRPGPNRIPEASVLFIIPIGMFLLSVEFLRKSCSLFKILREHRDKPEGV